MLKSYSPPFVTETDQPAPWLDCSWASALMLANMATLGKYPTTRNERQELRNASGDHFGGSNLHDVAIGIQVRYGWTLRWTARRGRNCSSGWRAATVPKCKDYTAD